MTTLNVSLYKSFFNLPIFLRITLALDPPSSFCGFNLHFSISCLLAVALVSLEKTHLRKVTLENLASTRFCYTTSCKCFLNMFFYSLYLQILLIGCLSINEESIIGGIFSKMSKFENLILKIQIF